jgi:hypothetical protein
MMNDKPFAGSKQFVRNDQEPNGILAGAAAGVADEWASPSAKPANFAGSRRASIQVSTAKCRAGGMINFAFPPKVAA